MPVHVLVSCVALLLGACAGSPSRPDAEMAAPYAQSEGLRHEDLLTAGLGLEGLRSPIPPPFANPAAPTAEELRRRSLWTNWRGIADLAPGGGYGELYGSVAPIAGREYHGLMRLPEAKQPHRVMAQIPDGFDARRRCLIVTASSGSRGIYGAIALAGAWGLPRGCAVAYTDKGTGTDWIELGSAQVHGLDGRLSRSPAGGAEHAFAPEPPASVDGAPNVAFKHAHSHDNPEADWGRHVKQAAEFGLQALAQAYPAQAPFTFENTRVIAAGLSNGGGAVLRATELDGDWFDGVVAVAPNVWAGEGGRALYDYATEAAIYMPCALLHPRFDAVALARPGGTRPPAWLQRCASLRAAGLLDGDTPEAQAQDAYARMQASGWSDATLEAGALSVTFDLWRSASVAYASAYARSAADAMPCGYAYALLDAQGQPRAGTLEERAAWWSDMSGIPTGLGVGILDRLAQGDDPALPGLRCLRALWGGNEATTRIVHTSVDATRAALPRPDLPLIVIHGADDGLVPEAFSSGAYSRWLAQQGRGASYWRVGNAQHFDAFLALPPLTVRYVPLLPYAYRALDAMWAHVVDGAPLPPSAEIAARPRAFGAQGIAPLTLDNLALP